MFNAVLLDCDGVLYEAGRPIPGAPAAVAWLQAHRLPHLFVTNTSSRPRSAVSARLRRCGIDAEESMIWTPAVAARRWLQGEDLQPLALFVPPATATEFAGLEQAGSDVKAVVLGDLGGGWDFATYNRAFRLLMDNPEALLVALGMTRYWRSEQGLQLDVGPFVRGLEYATGRDAMVVGKPARHFFLAAVQQLGVAAENSVMVGDDIRADVEGAQQAGLDAILVQTGKFRPEDLQLDIKPRAVLPSIADLPGWLEAPSVP